ncbi:MAG TPA: hypothetical protein VKA10_05325 [Prolixibacteraceae bacterium]|nr:hypothetical protein [Prolixibacteraceae bacterium]
MKKITLLFSTLLLIAFVSNAQPIEEGEAQLNAGFGLSTYGLPVYLGGEYGVAENFTVGGELSYRKWGQYSDYSPSITTIAALANYHVNELLELPPEWDLYGGLTLGAAIWSSGSTFYSARGTGLYFVGQVGGRYFFSDNFGVNLELGGGNYSGGKLGITLKI